MIDDAYMLCIPTLYRMVLSVIKAVLTSFFIEYRNETSFYHYIANFRALGIFYQFCSSFGTNKAKVYLIDVIDVSFTCVILVSKERIYQFLWQSVRSLKFVFRN